MNRKVSNRSGLNGDVEDPHCLVTMEHKGFNLDLFFASLTVTLANLNEQLAACKAGGADDGGDDGGADGGVDGGAGASGDSVVVRSVCLADGSASLAYDVIPAGTTDGSDIVTIYRPYPAEEGECVC